ncbi:amidohydrolase family protein [Niallia sp. 03133]|uniref:amidohydrolase family protein n=1 Tax=Niallia sp. 03133 TaxID=3458060 RepID=UPI004043C93D
MEEIQLYNVSIPILDSQHFYTLTIKNGVFSKVKKQGEKRILNIPKFSKGFSVDWKSQKKIDLEGRVILPSFVDIHTHLDKAFSLKMVPNKSGTLQEAILNYSQKAADFTYEEIKNRVIKSALQSLSYGTTRIRTHVNFELDISPKVALSNLQAVLEAKELMKPFIDLQIVPMFSEISSKSREDLEIIEEAISYGIDGIGGAPHLSPKAKEDIDYLFQLAVKHHKFIDLHVDEQDNPNVCTIEQIIQNTKRWDFQGRVMTGHLCSLSAMEERKAFKIIEDMAIQQIGAATLPGANMYLQGRGDKGLIRRGITRVQEMLQRGVMLATASDNVNDPFHPFGRGDLLQIGLLTAYTAHLASEKELLAVLRMMTSTPAFLFNDHRYGIKEGNAASFVLFDAKDMYDLFANLSPTRRIFHNGEWISCMFSDHRFENERLNQLSSVIGKD